MCDDFTVADENAALAAKGLTRRDFSAFGTAAVLATYVAGVEAFAAETPLAETMVMVPTLDGECDAFFVHPASGKAPGVILWPDVLGLRETKMAMGRRLAASGYAVLVVNQYYRSFRGPLGPDFSSFRSPEGAAKLGPARQLMTSEATSRDAQAFVAFLDGQAGVDKGRGIGTQGYCMGGPFTIRSAAAAPARVKAAASFHGGGLVTDAPDSPHKLLASTKASYLIAVAKNDDARARRQGRPARSRQGSRTSRRDRGVQCRSRLVRPGFAVVRQGRGRAGLGEIAGALQQAVVFRLTVPQASRGCGWRTQQKSSALQQAPRGVRSGAVFACLPTARR